MATLLVQAVSTAIFGVQAASCLVDSEDRGPLEKTGTGKGYQRESLNSCQKLFLLLGILHPYWW